ncbi:hypothetical protein HDU98_004306 [Podochytrium sp. JEL0797]|nr:hypothetical protein HDU98_004306 [Podochytrium sp. JEL0797]
MALRLRLLLSSSVIAGSVFFAGDVAAQSLAGSLNLQQSLGSHLGVDPNNINTHTHSVWDHDRTLKMTGTFFFIGDTSAQILTGKVKLPAPLTLRNSHDDHTSPPPTLTSALATWDHERTLKLTAFGSLVNGWYFLSAFHLLDKAMGSSGSSLKLAAQKSIVNQLVFSPPYLASFLYFSSAYVNPPQPGKSPTDIVIKKFPKLYASAWCVWPAVNLVSFRYIRPGVPRVAFLNVMGIAWTAYIAGLAAESESEVVYQEGAF